MNAYIYFSSGILAILQLCASIACTRPRSAVSLQGKPDASPRTKAAPHLAVSSTIGYAYQHQLELLDASLAKYHEKLEKSPATLRTSPAPAFSSFRRQQTRAAGLAGQRAVPAAKATSKATKTEALFSKLAREELFIRGIVDVYSYARKLGFSDQNEAQAFTIGVLTKLIVATGAFLGETLQGNERGLVKMMGRLWPKVVLASKRPAKKPAVVSGPTAGEDRTVKKVSDSPAATPASQLTDFKSKDEFEKALKSQKLIILDYYLPACAPCNKLLPILEGLAQNYPQVLFGKMNMAKFMTLAGEHLVDRCPTIAAIGPDGKVIGKIAGMTTKSSIEQLIQSSLDEMAGPKSPTQPAVDIGDRSDTEATGKSTSRDSPRKVTMVHSTKDPINLAKIATPSQLDRLVADNKRAVVYFGGPRCSSCVSVSSWIKRFAGSFEDIAFAEASLVDKEMRDAFKIETLPTVRTYAKGSLISTLEDPEKKNLRAAIESLPIA